MSAADPLLQPFRLRHLVLKNRVMSTAHAPSYVEDGLPRLRYQLYHEEKAKGGLALTMFGGSSSVARDSPSSFGQIDISGDRIIPVLQEFSARIHAHGCALMIQLTHAGRRTRWDTGDWLPNVSASPLREYQHRSIPKEMEIEDIRRVHRQYGDAAWRAKEGGLDGLEVICSSHLPDQFWSPTMNHRTDGYGGSLANRVRFTLEMFEEIRRRVGPDYIVGIRMSGNEMLEGGLSPEESVEIAARHAQSGLIDFVNVVGSGRLDRSRDLEADPDHGSAHGTLCRIRPCDPGRDQAAGVPCDPDHRPEHRPARARRGLRRHGRHDARPHRRPLHRRQGDARRGGPDPALRRCRLLHRPDLCRRRRAVRAQPGHGP